MGKMQKHPLSNDEWEITSNRFVAYIDIMGFKDMVARREHEDIYQLMQRVKSVLIAIEIVKRQAINQSLIKTTTYSDSIMVYSKDDSFDSLNTIAWTISALTNHLFTNEIPHKGALAFGKMTLNDRESIFFGQPLIDAYLLQEELYFYGTIIHATAESKFKELYIQKEEDINVKYKLNNIIDYDCPLKNGKAHHLTIYPIYAKVPIEGKDIPLEVQLRTSISNLRNHTSGYLRKYIDNTEEYIKYIRNSYNGDIE